MATDANDRDNSTDDRKLVLRFGGSLVEQLGAQLYPRVTASVAELVSNAWDADATDVWIKMPFGDAWGEDATIEVIDNGHGMTREDARERYLMVGRNRRKEDGRETSLGGRPLHGRKGIGKLAAFGTSAWLECVTRRGEATTAFAIDYEDLRTKHPAEDYEAIELENPDPLVDPNTGKQLESGTRVRLTKLKARRRTPESTFRRSMARRFALNVADMQVWINGEPLERFEYDVEIRFPRDGVPVGVTLDVDDDGWAAEEIDYSAYDGEGKTREVRWWIGFTKLPIPDEDVRGVSILTRGKLAQRPFTFEKSQGSTGQLAQEYLVGEVRADWIDHGKEAEQDLIQSNRDQLQLDNEELEPLLDWGRERLTWAMAERNKIRRERRVGADSLGSQVEAVLERAPARSRERLRTLAGRIADVTEADQRALAKAVEAVVEATDARAARAAGDDLRLAADPDEDHTWALLSEAATAAAPGRSALASARADALAHFVVAVREPPAKRLHRALATDPWIVWPLLDVLPHEQVQADDSLCVVRFRPWGKIVAHFSIACWAVGAEPSQNGDGPSADISIASAWPDAADGRLTWEEALATSHAAHAALVKALDES
jgi:hypothetical protein